MPYQCGTDSYIRVQAALRTSLRTLDRDKSVLGQDIIGGGPCRGGVSADSGYAMKPYEYTERGQAVSTVPTPLQAQLHRAGRSLPCSTAHVSKWLTKMR